jgi:predicted O-methyltransferase YrrM
MNNVLELGTSIGITTSYLASPSANINCFTLEGSPEIASIAIRNFKLLGIRNIKTVVGDIDATLDEVLAEMKTLDFVYFDANHKYDAVMRYFSSCLAHINPGAIFVFDDIYWSNGMEKAWNEIKNHPSVSSTIDLFQVGIVFFNPDLHKRHYKMRF